MPNHASTHLTHSSLPLYPICSERNYVTFKTETKSENWFWPLTKPKNRFYKRNPVLETLLGSGSCPVPNYWFCSVMLAGWWLQSETTILCGSLLHASVLYYWCCWSNVVMFAVITCSLQMHCPGLPQSQLSKALAQISSVCLILPCSNLKCLRLSHVLITVLWNVCQENMQ